LAPYLFLDGYHRDIVSSFFRTEKKSFTGHIECRIKPRKDGKADLKTQQGL
jgi:hypothetical protein